MKKIIFSCNADYPEHAPQKNSERYTALVALVTDLQKRNNQVFLVHPSEYRLDHDRGFAPHYLLMRQELVYYKTLPVEADVFMIRSECEDQPEKGMAQYTFLRLLKQKGAVNFFLNTPDAQERVRKDRLLELEDVPLIPTYTRTTREAAAVLVNELGKVFAKPMHGRQSAGTLVLEDNKDLEEKLQHINPAQYVFQPLIRSPSERRLVYLQRDLVGSLEWRNRNQLAMRQKLPYDPLPEEIHIGQSIMEQIGADFGCVDFLGDHVMEVNGSGTGVLAHTYDGKRIFNLVDKVSRYILSS